MKMPTFFEGTGVALVASLFGSMTFVALTMMFANAWVLRLIIAVLGFGYVVYLLGRSSERVGRIVAMVVWLSVAVAAWLIPLPLTLYLVVHLGLIWLIRSLYFHSSVLAALTDLGLNGLSLAAAIWASVQTGSLFLSIWCFFLMQALFVAIPALGRRHDVSKITRENSETRFQNAYRSAETAVRKLSSIN